MSTTARQRTFCELGGHLRLVHLLEHDREFIASVPPYSVGSADYALQASRCNRDQQAVADMVTEGFVDVGDAVNIQGQQRDATATPLGIEQSVPQAGHAAGHD